MATLSEVYQNPGDPRLYYKKAGTSDFTYITSPTQLQQLTQQGVIKAYTPGQAYAQLPTSSGTVAPPVVAQNAPIQGGTVGGATIPPVTTSPPNGQGDQQAFYKAFGQLMQNGKANQVLQDQKLKLLTQMYDRQLKPEEVSTLSPAQQEAIRNGDKGLLEFQVTNINNLLQGRTDDLNTSLDFLVQGYKESVAQAKTLADEANKRRDDARAIVLDMVNKYPSGTLEQAGITKEDLDKVSQTGEISGDLALKISKITSLAQFKGDIKEITLPDGSKVSAQFNPKTNQWEQINLGGESTQVSGTNQGSVSFRTNNPFNIKYGTFAKSLGATDSGVKASDGGTFAQFSSVDNGKRAGIKLLMSPSYSSLTVNDALKKWSNNGYDGSIIPEIENKKISSLNNIELEKLLTSMQAREGWKEPSVGGNQLSNVAEENNAQALATGGMTLDQLQKIYPSRGAAGQSTKARIVQRAREINPNLNLAQMGIQYDFAKSGNYQTIVTSIGAVMPNIDKIISLSDAWQRSDIPSINKTLRAIGWETGDETVTNIKEAQSLIGDEIGKALSGTGATSDFKIQFGFDALSPEVSQKNFVKNMALLKEFLQNKLDAANAFAGSYSVNAPKSSGSVSTPEDAKSKYNLNY